MTDIYKNKGSAWYYFIPALLWATVVLYLSLMPSRSLSSPSFLRIPNADKLVHFIFYFGMSSTILWGFWKSGWYRKSIFWYTIIGCSLLGLSVELMQQTERISRHFEMLDIIANIIGALLGAALFLKLFKLLPNGSRNRN